MPTRTLTLRTARNRIFHRTQVLLPWQTIHLWAAQGKVPAYRRGSTWFLDEQSIEDICTRYLHNHNHARPPQP
jgi:hypothetical protein